MSFRRDDLFIQEEILLLALKDDKGTFYMRTILPALGGAIMAELLLAGKIEVEENRKKMVNVISRQSFGDLLLDEALNKIAAHYSGG